jgi:hypothetical protein
MPFDSFLLQGSRRWLAASKTPRNDVCSDASLRAAFGEAIHAFLSFQKPKAKNQKPKVDCHVEDSSQ